jgi:cytidylate kinase
MSKNSKYKYRNITISGLPGCGSTTVLNMLREELKFDKWSGYSGGEFMRAYAEEKGLFDPSKGFHHSSLDYEDDFDRKIDMGVREKLQTEKNWILEAWLSGFLAQGVDGVLKILMVCSDDAVRVDRIVNRDKTTVEEAKSHIHQRYQENLGKWSRMYKDEWDEWLVKTGRVKTEDPIDFWREDIYDLVIDTYSHNQEQTLEMVMGVLKQ